MIRTIHRILFFLTLASLMTVCSGGQGPFKIGGGNDDSDSTKEKKWLQGSWKGSHSFKSDESSQDTELVELIFDGKGHFKMNFPSLENAQAEGSFDDLDSTLLFMVETSSLSLLGKDKSVVEYKYFLRGDVLRLEDDFNIFRLKRQGTSSGVDPSTGEDLTVAHGKWSCSNQGQTWTLYVRTENRFNAYVNASNARQLSLQGSWSWDATQSQSHLKTETASSPEAQGLVITLDHAGHSKNSASMTLQKSNGQIVFQRVSCLKD